ncbi:HU family DNA-binding protein [Lacticaseibacillus rhamnosus]|uniref:HU family DNA-binding protein n=1 Tax=Lacticaseibacillus rhamnosus TaxID=47715 RepID=UPI0032199A47
MMVKTGEIILVSGLLLTGCGRKGRNLRTGQEVKVPAKEVPVFTAGLSLKDAVNFSKQSTKSL